MTSTRDERLEIQFSFCLRRLERLGMSADIESRVHGVGSVAVAYTMTAVYTW